MKRTKRLAQHTTPDDAVTGMALQSGEEKLQHAPQRQEGNVGHLRDYTDWILEGWKQERPDLDVSPVAIINRLGRLSSYIRAELAAVYERFGLTGPSFAVIATLRRAGVPYQLSQRALMDILQLTSGTISVRIDRLVQDGLVERLPDPNDQRGVLVRLTEKGLSLFDQVVPVHLANEDRLLSALSAEQREQLASRLRILLLSFEPIPPEDPRHPSHWMGASLAPAHVARQIRRSAGLPDTPGLLVQAVAVPSPASRAGLQEGDLIISADGTEIRSIECLHEKLIAARGGTLTLEVLRGIEPHVLHMPIGQGLWIERTLYLDPRGTYQTERQVQVKLEDVYISLRAQREELLREADRYLIEQEVAQVKQQSVQNQLSAEEAAARVRCPEIERDYLFALRCLGDQIPIDAALMRQLLQRLASELLHSTGLARFAAYGQALDRRLSYLRGSNAEHLLLPRLLVALEDAESDVRRRAAASLG